MAAITDGSLLWSLRGYVSAAVGCNPDRITAASRFPDGNRHAVYKVSYLDASGATEDVVVRVAQGSDPNDCTRAEWEAKVLKKMGGTAAPVLYDFCCKNQWFETPTMCMQFVPGQQRELRSATLAEIEQVGSVVAWAHCRPVADLRDGPSKAGDLMSYAEGRLQSIISTLVWARDPLPSAVQVRLTSAANLVQKSLETALSNPSFNTGTKLVLLHGDPGPGNILWGSGPVLIDWEYARLGDPADEIAYLFDQNGLARSQREAFWRGYQDGVGMQVTLDHVNGRVDWWEPVTLLGSTLWWAERWVRRTGADGVGTVEPEIHRDAGYYADHVISRLDRFEGLLDRP